MLCKTAYDYNWGNYFLVDWRNIIRNYNWGKYSKLKMF